MAMAANKPYTSTDQNFIAMYRSSDGGSTWEPQIHGPHINDRPFLAIDKSGGSRAGTVYVAGESHLLAERPTRDNGLQDYVEVFALFTSRDGGHTFSGPALRAVTDNVLGHARPNAGPFTVLSDGTAVFLNEHLVYPPPDRTKPPGRAPVVSWLGVLTSKDGGASLSDAVKISDFRWRDGMSSSHAVNSCLAADGGSAFFKDRLYAAWMDAASGRGQIMLSYSADAGMTWSKPRVISDDRVPLDARGGPDDFMPAVAVNKEGVVGAIWYDRRDSPDNMGYAVRFSASYDGGETWTPSVALSSGPAMAPRNKGDHVEASVTNSAGSITLRLTGGYAFSPGHTSGLAADGDGIFHALWIDNRTGIQQVWTAPIRVPGKAVKYGSLDLSTLEDASDQVTLQLSDAVYDQSANTTTVTARLHNLSAKVFRGPIMVRATHLESELGSPRVLHADNGVSAEGAVWDFTPLLRNGQLAPNEDSQPKQLTFGLPEPNASREGQQYRRELVNLRVKVLAPAPPKSPEASRQ